MCAVELNQAGLQVSGSPLFLDARRKTPLSFVSHAHADHVARHDRVIATAATLDLMAPRVGRSPSPLAAPFHQPFKLGELELELRPAGHVLGSAQLLVIRRDGHRLVYTGDLGLTPSLTAEPALPIACDTLVIDATFGHPRFRFPNRAEVLADAVAWAKGSLEQGRRPIFLGRPIGKHQDLMRLLLEAGLPVAAEGVFLDVAETYSRHGVSLEGLPGGAPTRLQSDDARKAQAESGAGRRSDALPPDAVLIASARVGRQLARRLGPSARTGFLSGWALTPGAPQCLRADRVFAVSDHADHPSLVRYVEASGAREIVTCFGHAQALAESLRARGFLARRPGEARQLGLFGEAPDATRGATPSDRPRHRTVSAG